MTWLLIVISISRNTLHFKNLIVENQKSHPSDLEWPIQAKHIQAII